MPDAVRFKPLLDFVAFHEGTAGQPGGGYDTSLGYGRYLPNGRELPLSSFSLDRIDQIQTGMLANPANTLDSSALGRYQIVRTTLRKLRGTYGLQGDMPFSPVLQDQLGAALIEGRGRNPTGLRQEWQSLNRVSDAAILQAFDQIGTAPHPMALSFELAPHDANLANIQADAPIQHRALLRPIGPVDHTHMHLGKRHARHDKRVPALAKYYVHADIPPPPAKVDWFSKVASWGMMVNDSIGDCTCAAVGHIILQWTTYASEAQLLTDEQIIQLYEAVSGYNPNDPTTDQGAVETDVLSYWLNQGVFGDKLDGFASIEVGNINEIKDAINWFGNVYIGVQLPRSAQTQTVWAVPPGGAVGEGAPGSWGGHAVPIVGYDSRGLYCVTWGQIKLLTYGFWAAYCDEAYALLSQDFINKNTGATQGGIRWEQLVADMNLLKSAYNNAKSILHM